MHLSVKRGWIQKTHYVPIGRGMRTGNHQMPFLIDEAALLHRLTAPKDENDIGSFPVQNIHHRIGK